MSRWKILDNLRRSLMAPATVALLLLGWTVLPGTPLVWTAIALAAVALPVVLRLLQLLSGPARLESRIGVPANHASTISRRTVARVSLQLAFLANQAYEMVHAITITLVRLGDHEAPAARVGDGRGQRPPRRAAAPGRVRRRR